MEYTREGRCYDQRRFIYDRTHQQFIGVWESEEKRNARACFVFFLCVDWSEVSVVMATPPPPFLSPLLYTIYTQRFLWKKFYILSLSHLSRWPIPFVNNRRCALRSSFPSYVPSKRTLSASRLSLCVSIGLSIKQSTPPRTQQTKPKNKTSRQHKYQTDAFDAHKWWPAANEWNRLI